MGIYSIVQRQYQATIWSVGMLGESTCASLFAKGLCQELDERSATVYKRGKITHQHGVEFSISKKNGVDLATPFSIGSGSAAISEV